VHFWHILHLLRGKRLQYVDVRINPISAMLIGPTIFKYENNSTLEGRRGGGGSKRRKEGGNPTSKY
jgi:hypothetical protein